MRSDSRQSDFEFTGFPRRVILNLLGFPAAQFRLISSERVMVLPKVVALGVQLIIPVAGADRLPQLDVEPVCKGIAEQGGVTFRDPAVPQEKKNCIESELAVREQLAKQWSSFSADDRTHCLNETTMGGELSYTELLTCLEMAARPASHEG